MNSFACNRSSELFPTQNKSHPRPPAPPRACSPRRIVDMLPMCRSRLNRYATLRRPARTHALTAFARRIAPRVMQAGLVAETDDSRPAGELAAARATGAALPGRARSARSLLCGTPLAPSCGGRRSLRRTGCEDSTSTRVGCRWVSGGLFSPSRARRSPGPGPGRPRRGGRTGEVVTGLLRLRPEELRQQVVRVPAGLQPPPQNPRAHPTSDHDAHRSTQQLMT